MNGLQVIAGRLLTPAGNPNQRAKVAMSEGIHAAIYGDVVVSGDPTDPKASTEERWTPWFWVEPAQAQKIVASLQEGDYQEVMGELMQCLRTENEWDVVGEGLWSVEDVKDFDVEPEP